MSQVFWSRLFNVHGEAQPDLRRVLAALTIDATHVTGVNEVFQQRYLQKKTDGALLERWQLQAIDAPPPTDLYPLLRVLGMIDAMEPQGDEYAGIGIFGALQPRICVRLAATIDVASRVRAPQIFLLAGQRDLQLIGAEAPAILWEKTAPLRLRANAKPEKVAYLRTETDLMTWYWQEADMPAVVQQKPWDVVDAPKVQPDDPRSRPTTASQLQYWYDTKKPTPGRYLLVSNQPHVYYQEAVARNVLTDAGIEIEVVGPAARPDLSSEFLLGELARWIYEEASRWNKFRGE